MAGRDCSGLERRCTAWHGLVRRGEAVRAGNGAATSGVAWPTRHCETRLGKAGPGLAVLATQGPSWPRMANQGRAVVACYNEADPGEAGPGAARFGSRGDPRLGPAWPGGAVWAARPMAGPGEASLNCRGTAGLGVAWSGCRGAARQGRAWLGRAGRGGRDLSSRGKASLGAARQGLAVEATHGGPRLGWSWLGLGGEAVLVRQGRAQRGWARPGCRDATSLGVAGQAKTWPSRHRWASHGLASHGTAGPSWRGNAGQARARHVGAVESWHVRTRRDQAPLGHSGREGRRKPSLQSPPTSTNAHE